jgi:hypothetical protein
MLVAEILTRRKPSPAGTVLSRYLEMDSVHVGMTALARLAHAVVVANDHPCGTIETLDSPRGNCSGEAGIERLTG